MEVEVLAVGPDHLDHVDPFLGIVVTLLMPALLDTEHLELTLVPADHDVQSKTALADVIGGDHFLCRHHRIENRRVDRPEYGDAFGNGEQPSRPGDCFERRALIVGGPAISLPAADRQHKIDAGLVRQQREFLVIRPASRPTFWNQRHRAARGAIRAEQADLQLVARMHSEARIRRRRRSVHSGPLVVSIARALGELT